MRAGVFMVIAGEPSGDVLAAELVRELRAQAASSHGPPTSETQPLRATLEPVFFGAGGSEMARAGVELAVELTQWSVIGFSDTLRLYPHFKRIFRQLAHWAHDRQPDAIIGVDFSGFNRRFGHAIKQRVRRGLGPFHNWDPRLIQFVSPQVWASRPGRAKAMEADYDLLLSIFPFEKAWYERQAPRLRVEFVGHPMVDRAKEATSVAGSRGGSETQPPTVVLLPGSRAAEIRRHGPLVLESARRIHQHHPARFVIVLPNEALERQMSALPAMAAVTGAGVPVQTRVGGVSEALRAASVALASTGTVTLECAYFGVPTVAFYKTSWSTYEIGKRIVRVPFLAMPNLLAGEALVPEFIQHQATPAKLAEAAVALLESPARREAIRQRLAAVTAMLGSGGAARRAASLIWDVVMRAPNELESEP